MHLRCPQPGSLYGHDKDYTPQHPPSRMELDVGPQRTSPGQFLLIQVVEETAHWNMGKELALEKTKQNTKKNIQFTYEDETNKTQR